MKNYNYLILFVALTMLVHVSFAPEDFDISRDLWITIVKEELQPLKISHFAFIPMEHIIQNYTIYSYHEKFPNNLGEFYDCKDNKNTNVSSFAFTTSWNMDQRFLHLQNIYYAQTNLYMTNYNVGYYLDKGNQFKLDKRVLVANYEHCIVATGPYPTTYGDFVTGTLIRLTLIPKQYFSFSVTLSPYEGFKHLIIELLEALQVNNYTLVPAPNWDSGKMIFARNLYTVLYNNYKGIEKEDYMPHLTNFAQLYVNYGKIFLKHYHLENIEATDYTLYNRNVGDQRYINNFEDITKAIRKEHPDIDFRIITGHFKTTEEAARCWRKVKWNFATLGSNHLNTAFMHSSAVMCVYYLERYDRNIPATLTSVGIHFIIVQDPEIPMYLRGISLKIHRILPYVNRSLEVLRDGHL